MSNVRQGECKLMELPLKILPWAILLILVWLCSALREFYKVKPADYMPTSISPDLRRLDVAGCKPPLLQKENIPEVHLCGAEVARSPEDNIAGQSMFRQLAEEEFFDVPEDSAWDTELEPDLDGRRESTDPDETSDEDQVRQKWRDLCAISKN